MENSLPIVASSSFPGKHVNLHVLHPFSSESRTSRESHGYLGYSSDHKAAATDAAHGAGCLVLLKSLNLTACQQKEEEE